MKKYKFKAKMEAANGGGAFVLFPYDVEKEFGVKGRVPVKAAFDGVPYAGSLVKCGGEGHILGILKSIREHIGKNPGDTVAVEIWKDEGSREVEIPAVFQQEMKKAGLLAFFDGLSYTHRKEYCRWISEAKKEETRARRLRNAIEMLRNGVRTPDA